MKPWGVIGQKKGTPPVAMSRIRCAAIPIATPSVAERRDPDNMAVESRTTAIDRAEWE